MLASVNPTIERDSIALSMPTVSVYGAKRDALRVTTPRGLRADIGAPRPLSQIKYIDGSPLDSPANHSRRQSGLQSFAVAHLHLLKHATSHCRQRATSYGARLWILDFEITCT